MIRVSNTLLFWIFVFVYNCQKTLYFSGVYAFDSTILECYYELSFSTVNEYKVQNLRTSEQEGQEMVKTKLINKASGIGKDSGKPWYRVTLAADHTDGSRSVGDFFVSPEVGSKFSAIQLDADVYITAELDQHLHFQIADVRSASSNVTK